MAKITNIKGECFLMKRNMNEWCKQVIESPTTFAFPILSYPMLSKTDQKINDVITNPNEQYKLLKAVTETFPMPAIMIALDLTQEAEAFGCPVIMGDIDLPKIVKPVITDYASLENLVVPGPESARIPIFIKAAEIAAKNLPIPVFGIFSGPFSLGGSICNFSKFIIATKKDPKFVHGIVKKSTEFLIKYAKKMKEIGANGIVLAEPSPGIISNAQANEFAYPYVKQIVDAVQDDNFIVILHNCGGNVNTQVNSIVKTGVKGLSVGNAVDMKDIASQSPDDFLVLGNLDPTSVFRMGTPELVRKETLALLEKMKAYKNFVLSTGCDIPIGTPLENVQAMFDALAEYNNIK